MLHIYMVMSLWRDRSLHHKAEKTQDPGNSFDELHAHYWLEMHYFQNVFILSTVIAKILAVSRSTQLLQMLSCDSQIPLYLLQAWVTVLTALTDVIWTMCAYTWLMGQEMRTQGSWGWWRREFTSQLDLFFYLYLKITDLVSHSYIWLDS